MDGGDIGSGDCSDPPPAGTPPIGASDEAVGSGSIPQGCDALARAISSTLGTVMREFGSRADGTFKSQDELSLALDRLTGELDKLLEDAPVPLIMQHASKILSIRKRVSALNLLLKSIQRRIDSIDHMLFSGKSTERTTQVQDQLTTQVQDQETSTSTSSGL